MKRFVLITVGSFLFAYGFALFIEPANVAPGGLTGIVVIISRLYPTPNPGLIFLFLNIPLLVAGAIVFGIKFFLSTLYATLVSSVTMSLASRLIELPIISNELLMIFIGSVISGIGLALVFKGDATTGGTDIIARLLHKRYNYIRLGWIFFILDVSIILIAGLIFHEIQTVILSGFSAGVMSFVFNCTLYRNFLWFGRS